MVESRLSSALSWREYECRTYAGVSPRRPSAENVGNYLPLVIGIPDCQGVHADASPTAVIRLYHLPLGDIIVGPVAEQRGMNCRPDEVSKNTLTACIWSPRIRNGLHAFLGTPTWVGRANLDRCRRDPWPSATSTGRQKAHGLDLQWRAVLFCDYRLYRPCSPCRW